MIKIETTINGKTVEITTDSRTHGNYVQIWEYDGREWTTLYKALHPLQTDFEAVFSAVGELWGETVDVEKLFYVNDLPIRSSEDADCEKCGRWYHYAEMYALDTFSYLCLECSPEPSNEPLALTR